MLGKSADQTDTYKHIEVFSDVVAHIKSEYVEEPDMKSVTLGALNGLLEAIDPFASYLNADQYKDYLKNKDAVHADVGLILSKKSGYGLTVEGTVPDSPAAKAGLSSYDMIESIKGISTRDMPLAYAVLLFQGEPGSAVECSVVRAAARSAPDRHAYAGRHGSASRGHAYAGGPGGLYRYQRPLAGAHQGSSRRY